MTEKLVGLLYIEQEVLTDDVLMSGCADVWMSEVLMYLHITHCNFL